MKDLIREATNDDFTITVEAPEFAKLAQMLTAVVERLKQLEVVTERLAVDITEAGEMLGVGRSTIHKMVRAGKLPHVRIGRRIVIPIKALEEWLEQQASESWASFDASSGPGMEPRA